MKKLSEEKEMVVKKIIDKVVCNCCGKINVINNEYNMTDISPIDISFGYGSRFDLTTWEMDICDDCIEKWIKSFKHPIIEHENTFF